MQNGTTVHDKQHPCIQLRCLGAGKPSCQDEAVQHAAPMHRGWQSYLSSSKMQMN
jgi:hypothetical protein